MKRKTRVMTLGVWLATLLTGVLVIIQTHFVADLSAFMPRAPNERQQLLMDQLRDGALARLIMVGIEGGDATERARLSRELVANLNKTQLFAGVKNGEAEAQEPDRAYLFDKASQARLKHLEPLTDCTMPLQARLRRFPVIRV